MKLRRLLAAALVAFAEWSLVIVPTQAAINAPVAEPQIPHSLSQPFTFLGGALGPHDGATTTATGATNPRSFADHFSDAFSVLDFKAKCDGTTNDTTAIQAAANAAASLSVQLQVAPRGRTCLVDALNPPSSSHLRFDGMLKSTGAAKSLITFTGGQNNVVLEGDGFLDNGFPTTGAAPSASAPTACITSSAAISNITIRGLTLQNCGNWPVNLSAYTGTPYAGSKHIYVSYVKAIGGGNRNSFEFADGCDDCWADHLYIDGLVGDIGFAFYGNITNSGLTNSRINNAALGVAVLSDGTPGNGAQSFPSSNILIQGNDITNNGDEAIFVHSSSSTDPTFFHKAIRIIGNTGSGNNTNVGSVAAQANKGGLSVLECDGCYSSGNIFHDDGASSATARPVAGFNISAQSKNFTSVGDTVYNEGINGGVGIGAAIGSGATNVAFYGFRAYDNTSTTTDTTSTAASTSTTISVASGSGISAGQTLTGTGVPAGTTVASVSGTTVTASQAVNIASGAALSFTTYTPTMVQAIGGTCAADCSIIGTRTNGFANPWAGLTYSGSARLWQNEGGLGNYVQADTVLNGNVSVLGPNLVAGGTTNFQGLSSIATNINSQTPPNGTQGLGVGWNFSSGSADADLFSLATNGPINFYSKTSATAATRMATLTPSGGAFDQTIQFTQGLNARAQSSVSAGTFTDPATGATYDLKLGGPGNGLAVGGASFFGSTLGVVGHIYGKGSAPSVTVSTGSLGLSTGANDNHGTINTSAAATVTVTFAQARTNNVDCSLTAANGTPPTNVSATNTKLTFSTSSGQYVTYICMGL